MCFWLLIWCHLRYGAEIHHGPVLRAEDPDTTAVRAVRLCVAPALQRLLSSRLLAVASQAHYREAMDGMAGGSDSDSEEGEEDGILRTPAP